MNIKRFNEFTINEETKPGFRSELFGNQDRLPSNVISRHEQDFYDYYSRSKFKGMSKYELNTKMFELAQRKDEIGTIAQFCLQVERESINSDNTIKHKIEELAQALEELGVTTTAFFDEEEIPVEGEIDNVNSFE